MSIPESFVLIFRVTFSIRYSIEGSNLTARACIDTSQLNERLKSLNGLTLRSCYYNACFEWPILASHIIKDSVISFA